VPAEASVVIPTRDRPRALRRCLEALARQHGVDVEVIVVDDGSADAGAVADALDAHPAARLVRGEGRGPAAARNAGWRAAQARVVLFTDDDCEPAPWWAAPLARCASARPAAGRTVNVAPGRAAAAAQIVTRHLQATAARPDGTLGFAPTCNLAAPAELVESLPFDESFPAPAGEDREWCARAVAAGQPIALCSDAVVRHRHEMGTGEFLRQQFRYGRGAARFHQGGTPVPPAHRRRPSLYAGFARAGLREGAGVGALVVAAQIAAAAGYALEAARS
jgi:glycosyltransferase involved in cell wall biosynthesis